MTEIDSGRRAHLEETAEVFHKNWNGMITSTYNIKEAVSLGLLMRGPDGVLCCVGSLYLVGSIKEIAGEIQMINFDEELKKFQPSLEVDQAEDAIYKNDLRDVMDIVEDMLAEMKKEKPLYKRS